MTATPSAATPATPARPPGPSSAWFGIPLLRAMARDYLGFVQGLQHAHGDVSYMRLGFERAYDVFSPELVRELLVDHADSLVRWERGIAVFAQSHGHSVLIAEGARWQRQRRLLQPGFSPKRLKDYGALMVAATARRLQALPVQGPVEVDFEHEMTQLTMDVILRTLFSSEAADEALAAEEAVRVLTHTAMHEMFMPMTLPDWLPLPGKARKRWALRALDELVLHHITQRRTRPRGADATPDLLDMLLAVRDEQGQGLSAREIRDECMTTFQAGHETTATALTWWGHVMASHPAAAERATAEVDAALSGGTRLPPSGPRAPGIEDLGALPYLTATLKEAMRLHPPVAALMSRRLVRDVQLGDVQRGGWRLPKGALVRITPWVLHHDPRWFDEPETFRPERFLAADAALPRGAYMPFGTGPRVCLGQHFALAEMTLIAAMLLQRFALQRIPGEPAPQPQLNVTLRPAHGLRLRLLPRGHVA
ncbi:MAG: cytochrome P450 [Burkholderiales bacterium]